MLSIAKLDNKFIEGDSTKKQNFDEKLGWENFGWKNSKAFKFFWI